MSNRQHRRKFLRAFGGISASLGALVAGIIPEAHSQTPGRPLAGRSATSSQQINNEPPPPDPPLPPAEVNALYAAALNDPDAFALTQELGESVRIDPPERSYEHFTNGQRSAVILAPIKANNTGASVAYLYFGTMGVLNDQGQPATLPIRITINSTGPMRISLGGAVQTPNTPEIAEVLWAALFPEQYVWNASAQTPIGGGLDTETQRMRSSAVAPIGTARQQCAIEDTVQSPNVIPRGRLPQAGNIRAMRAADDCPGGSPPGTPRRACEDQLLGCIRTTITPCAVASVAAVVCTVCVTACTLGTWGIACWGCTVPCGTAAGFGTACYLILRSCADQWKRCLRECNC